MAKVVYNKILGRWYVVTGPHHAPLSGGFGTRAAAQKWLDTPHDNGQRIVYKRVPAFTFTTEDDIAAVTHPKGGQK
jgi:hypothetical protein